MQLGKKFARYIDEIGINQGKLVFHSLRKFFNNYMKEQGVVRDAMPLGMKSRGQMLKSIAKIFR